SQERYSRERDWRALTAHQLGGAIGERARPGLDRLVVEITAHIAGQRRHRGVALPWVFLQSLRDNTVQVRAKDSWHFVARHNIRQALWLGFHGRLQQLGGRVWTGAGWMLPR